MSSRRSRPRRCSWDLDREKTAVIDFNAPFHFLGFRFEKQDHWGLLPTGVPAQLERTRLAGGARSDGVPHGFDPAPRRTRPRGHRATKPRMTFGPGAGWVEAHGDRLICRYEDGSTTPPVTLDRVGEVILLGRCR